jgi:plasmid stabilization system protein ParE
MKVRYSPQVRNDLQDIFQYLHDRSPSGAANVMRAIYAGIMRRDDHLQNSSVMGLAVTQNL